MDALAFIGELVPPKHFENTTFTNYEPDTEYPSQRDALDVLINFVAEISHAKKKSKSFITKIFSQKLSGRGLYLDGGFGVGKTHLLAASYYACEGNSAFLSFQELMFLVGLQSLTGVFESLRSLDLLIIDEFELDDPANTRISTNLLGQLFHSGVSIITSSNTPPGALGEGKFSVEDFERELGELTSRFRVVKIDGEDYRSKHLKQSDEQSTWFSEIAELEKFLLLAKSDAMTIDTNFTDFLHVLSKVHPMRIRRAIGKLDRIILRDVKQISHPHEALRFVYFIDKAYDSNLSLIVQSHVAIEKLFHSSYFTGGDTKKFLRTMSRLGEMCFR